jgi:hypothetical protein
LPDFWRSSGYRLLQRDGDGRLAVTDDFLRAYLLRPELAPVPQSDDAEIALHDALLADPRRRVAPGAIAAIGDADVRDNIAIWLRFRDRLLSSASLEAAYAGLFRGEGVDVAPLFVDHLTQVICRHLLGDAAAPLEARMAELLFRPQRISVRDEGTVMAADDETVERFASDAGFGSLGEWLRRENVPLRTIDLDVLSEDNGDLYWTRDERFDTAVSLDRAQPAMQAFCRVLARWVRHFHDVEVSIKPERAIDDDNWLWHVGLDAEASGILNDLYNRVDVDEAQLGRLLCLFCLEFADPSVVRPHLAGKPVYLALAMDASNRLRVKPQNLIVNLPLARSS